jgi:hypothetical protein
MTDVERSPLTWPAAQVRVRVQDQKTNSAWKKSTLQYMEALEKEFGRMKVTRYVVTYNDPSKTGSRDPGIAVWFSRKQEENFKWQDILGIDNPYPTVAEIEDAYRRLAPKYHPDRNPDIDPTKFAELTEARRKATAWVRGTDQHAHEYVIACDQFKETRHNLNAIVGTLRALRAIERYGATTLYEQAFHAFVAIPENIPAREASHA